jgi:carnitine O-acetyltransferase
MTVHTFTMPKSLNESLASSQPPMNDTNRSSAAQSQQVYSPAEREPLASHKPDGKPGITYASQDKLQKLPIPELESTCEKYKDALKPLQNSREQADTAAAVADFLKSDGPELQSRLKKYATGKTSYIEQFCTSQTRYISAQRLIELRVRLLPQFR